MENWGGEKGMKVTKKKIKRNVDFTATLGDERKKKLQRIAESENRTMAGQVKEWIDKAPEPAQKG